MDQLEKLKTATKDVPLFSLAGTTLPAKVVELYDGDSPTIVIPLFGSLYKFKTRMLGIDTLEMKVPKYVEESKRQEYQENAYKARNYVLSQAAGCPVEEKKGYTKKEIEAILSASKNIVTVKCDGFDKYGRLLIHMFVGGNETSVSQQLIDKKMAYAYDGGTKDKTVTDFE